MAKDKTTTKDSTKSDKSTEKTNRGRPTSIKKDVEVKGKKEVASKKEDVKNDTPIDTKPVDKVNNKSSKSDNNADKAETKTVSDVIDTPNVDVSNKAPEIVVTEKIIEPVLSEEESLFAAVYGNEPLKETVSFPNSEQITQTIAKLKECNIIVGRLPNDVLSLVNDFANAFTIFTSNPMLGFHMITEIQEKDNKAIEALNNWIEPRKNSLIRLNGGISISESTTNAPVIDDKKVIIDSKNVSSIIPTMPIVNANVTNPNVIPAIQSNNNSNVSTNQNNGLPFVSQSTGNSYQHHVHSNNPTVNSTVPLGFNENKDIHAEMLSKNNAFLDVHKNQSPLNNQNSQYQQPAAIDPKQYFVSYAETIIALIKSVWQFSSWGYIPTSVLMDILNSADKGFAYEIVKYDDETVSINISKGADKISTERFSCKD